ncbi:MAG: hypothetical protein HN348_10045 [Proteobacteria bacterium]|jgi:hypothetical protein|nr:hypothetical protein [Pseudomonadota bacterium]
MRRLTPLIWLCCLSCGVTIHSANIIPTVTISAPGDLADFVEGELVTVTAHITDPDTPLEDLELTWSVDYLGDVYSGTPEEETASIEFSDLIPGRHRIAVAVVDPRGGYGSDAISVDILQNSPPTALFLAPVVQGEYAVQFPLQVSVQLDDPDLDDLQTLSVSATVDIGQADDVPAHPQSSGLVEWVVSDLVEGPGTIEVNVSDGIGSTSSELTFVAVNGDYDGDGDVAIALGGTDCDDGDPLVWSGADEKCDGIDQNCNWLVDENAIDASLWYRDMDDDGYGDDSTSVTDCVAPSGYVASGGDCNDTRSDLHPAADELCNGVDDDCDTKIDEADSLDAALWYADGDGDGYGLDSTEITSCDHPGSGWVSLSGDCNDGNAAVLPGADEWCNSIDDDCDGVEDENDALDAVIWYLDRDLDGFGRSNNTSLDCLQPAPKPSGAQWVDSDGDCDDNDLDIYPGAKEWCGNSVDDDCDGNIDEDDAVDVSVWYLDSDGDQWGANTTAEQACVEPTTDHVALGGDCDEADVAINPGADEVCGDGVDNDCDGLIDDASAVDALTWHQDADGDGYGSTDVSAQIVGCTGYVGMIVIGGDCDDGDETIFPGADEWCGGGDEDCDGIENEDDAVDAPLRYIDGDHDNYGNDTEAIPSCEPLAGRIDQGGDCADSIYEIHPDIDDVCANQLDDDCNGLVDDFCVAALGDVAQVAVLGDTGGACFGGTIATLDNAAGEQRLLVGSPCGGETHIIDAPFPFDSSGSTLKVVQTRQDADLGFALTGLDDVDGDLVPDFAVATPQYVVSGAFDGLVDIVSGASTGSIDDVDSYATIVNDHSQDEAFAQVLITADIDCDGDGDLVVGASQMKGSSPYSPGGVFLFTMPIAGGEHDISEATTVISGTSIMERFGESIANVGDADGDGCDDVLVGAPMSDFGGINSGGAFLIPTDPSSFLLSKFDAEAVLVGENALDYVGSAVAAGGDVNMDGHADIWIAGPEITSSYTQGGVAYLVLGSVSSQAGFNAIEGTLDLKYADARIEGGCASCRLGSAISAGDFDGDGSFDAAIGEPGHDGGSGALRIWLGPIAGSMGVDDAWFTYAGDNEHPDVGVTMATGRFDGDGLGDLAVGVGDAYGGDGAVFILFGAQLVR